MDKNDLKHNQLQIKMPLHAHLVGVVLVIYLLGGSLSIVLLHLRSMAFFEKTELLRLHTLCGSFGFIGATVSLIRKYYQHLITISNSSNVEHFKPQSNWSYGWIYYYLVRPLVAAILGALSFTLSFTGFRILSSSQDNISVEGNFLLFAIAFLTGFGLSNALDRLSSKSKEIFANKDI